MEVRREGKEVKGGEEEVGVSGGKGEMRGGEISEERTAI